MSDDSIPSVEGYEEILRSHLRQVAAEVGVPAELLGVEREPIPPEILAQFDEA